MFFLRMVSTYGLNLCCLLLFVMPLIAFSPVESENEKGKIIQDIIFRIFRWAKTIFNVYLVLIQVVQITPIIFSSALPFFHSTDSLGPVPFDFGFVLYHQLYQGWGQDFFWGLNNRMNVDYLQKDQKNEEKGYNYGSHKYNIKAKYSSKI